MCIGTYAYVSIYELPGADLVLLIFKTKENK